MLDLAMHMEDEPVPAKIITERQGIPARYLERILNKLRKFGLIESVRGVKGGYMLAKKPDEIRVLDIITALEGSLAPVKCVDQETPECEQTESCVARVLWSTLKAKIEEALSAITLEDLCADKQDVAKKLSLG
jgi:Rrf2 family protein